MAVSDSAASAVTTTDCFTCAPLQKYVALTQTFADNLSNTLYSPMLILFSSLAGLWIAVSGVKLSLGQKDYNTIVKELTYISITGILLGSKSTTLISYIYSSAISIMSGSATAVFSIVGSGVTAPQYDGMTALAATAEQAVFKIFQVAGAIVSNGSFWRPGDSIGNWLYAVVLILPYFLLIIAFASQVVVSIFRATMIGVFAPFLFMAYAFNWGQGMAMSGAKTLLASIMVLFACTASVALCLYGVASLGIDPKTMTGDTLTKFVSITNADFLVVLFLGWAGTALLAEGTSIANSIAGSALTNTAAGIMTAGISGSAIGAARLVSKQIGGQWGDSITGAIKGGASYGAEKIGYGGAAMTHTAKNLLDKFKNINKPGDGA